MSRESPRSAPLARTLEGGRVALLLGASGAVMVLFGLAAYLGFAPADRTPVRLISFVLLPVAIVLAYAASRGQHVRRLFVLVALLDLEAVLLGELPVEGMPVAVAIPLIGVAFVTYLLPAESLRLPYLAAWLASTIGVAVGVVTWVTPASVPVPTWTLVPTFCAVDAAGILVLWQVNSRRAGALQAITEAETRFRELLNGVELVAADIGADGRVAWANEFGSKLLGWRQDEVVGIDYYETFVPADRREEARARLRRLSEGREVMPRRRESEIVTRNGERHLIRWAHVVRHDENGRFASMASIGEDITTARRAEEAFRRVSQLDNALIKSSPVPTAVLDLDRTVQRWNPALAELLGWTEEEVLGKPLPDLVPPETDRATLANVFASVSAGRQVRGAPARILTRDGRVVVVRIYATALCNAAGEPVAIAAQAIDVTAQEAMEAKLRESQKMEAVGRLAGGVAHDFNNSLTAIGGFAALIAASTDDAEIQQEAESISAAVRRSANLTRELLAYARRSLLQPEAVDVNALVGAIRPMLRRLLGEDIALVIESGVSEATVRVDPGQFEQALLNLAVNARDAMPEGGQITISTGRRPMEAADGEAAAGSWVTVSVSDTGGGIAADVLPKVFDPFFTTKPVGMGTGLGLAMVQGFVLQSGGRVSLRSDPGQGTAVEIQLPEVAKPRFDKPAAPEPGTALGGGETILFVEDEPAVAAVGFQILSRRGYRVLLADSGTAAIALLRAHTAPIALVLSDVILPDMRGPQVVEVAAVAHPEAAVLFASGYSADTFVSRGEIAPGVELIQKPYSPDQLARRVRDAIDRSRAASAGAA